MHNVAIRWVAAEDVGNDLAKCLWIEALVDVFDGSVDVFLCGAHTALHVTVHS